METKVENGYLSPRYFQLVRDRIESKQAMEPIAIAAGIGPIIGYDLVDKTKSDFTITGSNQISLDSVLENEALLLNGNLNKCYISVDNFAGNVVNAHITPSGIMSIDPRTLTFSNVTIDWARVDTNPCIVIVKASRIYKDEPSDVPPSMVNFSAFKTTTWKTAGRIVDPQHLLKLTWAGLLTEAKANGFEFSESIDVLIGVYCIGRTQDNVNAAPEFYERFSNVIPLIPRNHKWPPVYGMTLLDAYNLFMVNKRKIGTNDLIDKAVTEAKLGDGSVSTRALANSSVTEAKLGDGSVSTSKIGDKAVTEAKLGDGSVSTSKIGDKAVTLEKIKPGGGGTSIGILGHLENASDISSLGMYDIARGLNPYLQPFSGKYKEGGIDLKTQGIFFDHFSKTEAPIYITRFVYVGVTPTLSRNLTPNPSGVDTAGKTAQLLDYSFSTTLYNTTNGGGLALTVHCTENVPDDDMTMLINGDPKAPLLNSLKLRSEINKLPAGNQTYNYMLVNGWVMYALIPIIAARSVQVDLNA